MQRRSLIQFGLLSTAALITGCTTNETGEPESTKTYESFSNGYGAVTDGGFAVPAVPIKRINQKYHRQIVKYYSRHPKGTIIVNTRQRYLYYIMSRTKAVRYGIGVGREGFAWEGEAYIAWKRKWPKWTPPMEMVERQPNLRKYAKEGMKPGLRNPLGSRALYLFDSETRTDTLFRLHGTPEWKSIGTAASSGCIRLINQDIIDLYDRVTPGTRSKVIVIQ